MFENIRIIKHLKHGDLITLSIWREHIHKVDKTKFSENIFYRFHIIYVT